MVWQTKLQHFTIRGVAVAPPKYEFTRYEDIVAVALDKGTVTVSILSDTDSAKHELVCSAQNAAAIVELICGYRRMLEAYVKMGTFAYAVKAVHPHPALYAKVSVQRRAVCVFQW